MQFLKRIDGIGLKNIAKVLPFGRTFAQHDVEVFERTNIRSRLVAAGRISVIDKTCKIDLNVHGDSPIDTYILLFLVCGVK